MHRFLCCWFALCLAARAATPAWLEDRFEVPEGFRIYRAAGPALSGGSYALAFDGEGRLLVGDGNAVRRLSDDDHDGVFDRFEIIATGLGPRGPQGLLVDGDTLYAVGGDGLQRFTGYRSGGPLVHRGRLGNPLRTGGDHDAHTILRGHDGWLHLMAGNGSGLTNRLHITEPGSPALFEREASVFRVSPDGQHWECLASGGRNPPSLGQNYLGDLFSFDSDMEWHVGLPWYRPVRLNHWAIGGDQGWQEVGAYPPYFIDNLPGILDVGRGSPTWGVFYEHTQWPEKYHNAFLVCDYRWKRESNDQYATTGRLVAFFLRRQGAGWAAAMETVAKPRPGARDAEGRLLNFALVDVAVGPDGSLFMSDHNQGIWRLCHVPGGDKSKSAAAPDLVPGWGAIPAQPEKVLEALLTLPQPESERTRLRAGALREGLGRDADRRLERAALTPERPLAERLRAIRLLAPGFAGLPREFLGALAREGAAEIRGQAAWLLSLQGGAQAAGSLIELLGDPDPFVRRRAAEWSSRLDSAAATPALIERLNDPERLIRHVAMNALSHRPTSEWFEQASAQVDPQPRLRALVASLLRREPPAETQIRQTIASLLASGPTRKEDRLDLFRTVSLFQKTIESDAGLLGQVQSGLLAQFPDPDRELRWEQIRLLGEFRVGRAFPALLHELEIEPDPVTQFHLAQALSALPSGWSLEEEQRAVAWLLGTQRGWFAELNGKGVQFAEFWSTVLTEFGTRHRNALVLQAPRIDLSSLLGGVLLGQLARSGGTGLELLSMYQQNPSTATRVRILTALRPLHTPQVADFLLAEHERLEPETADGIALSGAILQHWADKPDEVTLPYLVYEGLFHDNPQVVRAAATGLVKNPDLTRRLLAGAAQAPVSTKPTATQADLATDLISRMMQRAELLPALENILVIWSGQQRPGFKPGSDLNRKPDEPTRAAAAAYWQQWYSRQFARKFEPVTEQAAPEKTDEEIHRFLLGNDARGGAPRHGAAVYESLQCQTCHGGGVSPGKEGRLFGPDLAGVTRRLNRQELADALVYPSKQVAERYRSVAATLKDGTVLTGFVTDQNADAVTLAEQEQVRRIPRSELQSLSPLTASLMPERLLNRLSSEQLRDLLAFLEEGIQGK